MACCGRNKVVRAQPSNTTPTQFRTPINYNSLQPTSNTQPKTNNLVCSCGGTLKIKSTYVSGDNQKKANVVCDKCQLVRIVAI